MAGPGVWVPSEGGAMPYYFSGTNCRASGISICPNPDPEDPSHIITAILFINDFPVTRYDWKPGEPIPMSVSLSAMFDSTHFTNGAAVIVRMDWWDNHGNTGSGMGSSTVHNSVLLAQHPDPYLQGSAALLVGDLLHGPTFGHD